MFLKFDNLSTPTQTKQHLLSLFNFPNFTPFPDISFFQQAFFFKGGKGVLVNIFTLIKKIVFTAVSFVFMLF